MKAAKNYIITPSSKFLLVHLIVSSMLAFSSKNYWIMANLVKFLQWTCTLQVSSFLLAQVSVHAARLSVGQQIRYY
jgi:hypothetical protein